ncbi:MAG: YbhB/YbcL family Raf kinase inhibitor-like protein [Candidatus Cryosericum sp.]
MEITLTTTAFAPGKPIPVRYTAQGEDVSPDLSWKNKPNGVASFALICDDPDAPAGTWVHWTIWNIPGTSTELPLGVPVNTSLPDGSVQGVTSGGTSGYHGPMPPRGNAHRYFFRIYALDTVLSLPASANRAQLDAAMKGHVLSQGQVMGTYQRH